MTDILSSRTISALPLSVGTSLALESVFSPRLAPIDENRIIPQKVNITDYQDFWFNLSTLFRNLFSSITKEDILRVSPGEWVEVLMQEIEFIEDLVTSESTSRTRAYFYICEYKGLEKYLGEFASLRVESTESQRIYRAFHNETIQACIKRLTGKDNIFIFDHELKPKVSHNALIMTHICHDLLSYKNFRVLDLIESHTGVLKKKHTWNSKYHGGKELSMMPFNIGLLKIFGDSQTYKPMDIRFRKAIIDLAVSKQWTPVTTVSKIKYDIGSLPNAYYVQVALSLF